ncbi:hypothetical protein NDU88_005979 [Pleurodeles waltl]|uniref:Uncharacterized protein n=1 Tax=Pleurodeles waltl TaxID=8319 RepID=A0AAV7MCT1_PLEWA|nr:hypothetical protein NDU88_005979 [Pleurodeles waltl]
MSAEEESPWSRKDRRRGAREPRKKTDRVRRRCARDQMRTKWRSQGEQPTEERTSCENQLRGLGDAKEPATSLGGTWLPWYVT